MYLSFIPNMLNEWERIFNFILAPLLLYIQLTDIYNRHTNAETLTMRRFWVLF